MRPGNPAVYECRKGRETVKVIRSFQYASKDSFSTISVMEAIPGGFHTMERVFIPLSRALPIVCPNCGNGNQDRFKTVVEGTVLLGAFCMACGLPDGGTAHTTGKGE